MSDIMGILTSVVVLRMGRVFAHLFTYPLRGQISTCLRHSVGCLLTLRAPLTVESSIVEMLRDARKKIPIAVHGPFHDMYLGSIDPYIREATLRRLSESARLAAGIKAEFMTIHLNYIEELHGRYRGEWIENAAEALNILGKEGIRIHLENTREDDPAIFAEILERSGSSSMCLDIGHVVAFSAKSIETWIGVLSPYIEELHLHECSRGRDIHEPLGSGLIDWENVFLSLERAGIDLEHIYLTLEPRNENELIMSLRYLRDVIGIDD